jgi:glyoxylase-like metal-dependent hydrolase (beta-lactamase superfamily II)
MRVAPLQVRGAACAASAGPRNPDMPHRPAPRGLAWPLCLAVLAGAPASHAAPVAIDPDVLVERDTFDPGEQPDGNSVLFLGPRGTVVFDTGRHARHTQAVADAAAARRAPIVAVVNSHWHLDHLGGNAWLRMHAPGVRVYASEAVAPALAGWLANSRREMQAMLDAPADARPDAATEAMLRIDIALIDTGPALLPDVVVGAARTLDANGRVLLLGHEGPAATAADLWIYDPQAKVLATGDLVTLPAPFLDTACAPGWRAALAHLDAVPFVTLVPGHGAPMSRPAFTRWRRAFEDLLDCAAGTSPTSTCAANWVQALGPLLAADQHEKAQRMTTYYLDAHLRAAPGARDRFCR